MNKQIEYGKALQLNDGVLEKYGVNYFFDNYLILKKKFEKPDMDIYGIKDLTLKIEEITIFEMFQDDNGLDGEEWGNIKIINSNHSYHLEEFMYDFVLGRSYEFERVENEKFIICDNGSKTFIFDKNFNSLRGYALCFSLKSLSKYEKFVFEILKKENKSLKD